MKAEEAPDLSPADLARENARRKAEAVAAEQPGRWILGADTVVAQERRGRRSPGGGGEGHRIASRVFGKPASLEQARDYLRVLSGHRHEVITACALISPACDAEIFHEVSHVTFRVLSEETIGRYLAEVNVLDKAGAYALQEHGEWIVERVEGSRANVIGLPTEALEKSFARAGIALEMTGRATCHGRFFLLLLPRFDGGPAAPGFADALRRNGAGAGDRRGPRDFKSHQPFRSVVHDGEISARGAFHGGQAHPGDSIFGRMLEWGHVFAIDRTKSDRAALRTAMARLEAGNLVGIFPEKGIRHGQTSVLGGAELPIGTASLWKMMDVPVIPMLIIGTDQLYAWRNFFRRPRIFCAGGEGAAAGQGRIARGVAGPDRGGVAGASGGDSAGVRLAAGGDAAERPGALGSRDFGKLKYPVVKETATERAAMAF